MTWLTLDQITVADVVDLRRSLLIVIPSVPLPHPAYAPAAAPTRLPGPRWGWVVISFALAAILCVTAVPVAWFVRETRAAGRGEVTPSGAVTVYLLALSAGDKLGMGGPLAPERRDELLAQWLAYRAEMDHERSRPSRLGFGVPAEESVAAGRVAVTADVYGIWFLPDAPVGSSILNGERHPWRFETRLDQAGWRVWSADLPAWCGVHVRPETCA
jgi:hypothetical protein